MSASPTSLAALHVRSDLIGIELLPQVGARLHRLRAFGRDLLRTPDDPEQHLREPFYWGGFNMAPWCNRIEAGPVDVGGRTIDLPSNFEDGSAIHGQVYAVPWNVVDEGSCTVVGGGDGWPWRYRVTITVSVEGDTLSIAQSVENLSDSAMPAGIGLHPWFPRSTRLAINADGVYPTNTNSPAHPIPVSGEHDLRGISVMADGIDATWTQPGDPAVELHWPEAGVRASMASDAPTLHITAAVPSQVGALAVEPQTHAPQGLRRLLRGEPGALARLEPNARLSHTITMIFRTEDD